MEFKSTVLDYLHEVRKNLIKVEQRKFYPKILVSNGILRVKNKLVCLENILKEYPILLPKRIITKLIINDIHVENKHIGFYSLLAEIRKQFWIHRIFSTIKKFLKECIVFTKVGMSN